MIEKSLHFQVALNVVNPIYPHLVLYHCNLIHLNSIECRVLRFCVFSYVDWTPIGYF